MSQHILVRPTLEHKIEAFFGRNSLAMYSAAKAAASSIFESIFISKSATRGANGYVMTVGDQGAEVEMDAPGSNLSSSRRRRHRIFYLFILNQRIYIPRSRRPVAAM